MTDEAGCASMNWSINTTLGTCYDDNNVLRGMFNETLAKENKIKRILPSQEYFE